HLRPGMPPPGRGDRGPVTAAGTRHGPLPPARLAHRCGRPPTDTLVRAVAFRPDRLARPGRGGGAVPRVPRTGPLGRRGTRRLFPERPEGRVRRANAPGPGREHSPRMARPAARCV